MVQDRKNMLTLTQIGANTSDLPGTLRLFSEAFGFVNSGGNGAWGETLKLQGLPGSSRALLWFMVGAQKYFQFEFLNHTMPVQRRKRPDWNPADHGWNRFGVAVRDFDACMNVLQAFDIATITPPITEGGLRRAAFSEPFIQCVIEVFEKGPSSTLSGPEVVYAAQSVSDLAAARDYYCNILQLEVEKGNDLHRPEHEALWGLNGAKRETFVARGAGDILIEVLQYRSPVGQPRPADYRMSDQGMVNISLGSRDKPVVAGTVQRSVAIGVEPPVIGETEDLYCANINVPEREFEFSSVPEHLDAVHGMAPSHPFYS